MDKAYDHKLVEDRLYNFWEKSGYFKPEVVNPNGKPFSIVLPPPNVTGNLHIGHSLMLVIQDILIRFERMRGKKTVWIPGTDHAAIATQSKVENIIYKKENKTRYDLGRDEFIKRVEEFAKDSHDNIVTQIRRLGASVDWSREAYTLDDKREEAVRTAFKTMYEDNLIYQGETIINWDPKMQTTVSDDEIEWMEEKTDFYYLKYGPFVIGTARPETKFGDKYVVMHPKDRRYLKYKQGQKIEVDWISGKVEATIIKDEAVDMNFGTGVMTITPWHDRTDFEIARRHSLIFEQIIDFKGKLMPIAKEFEGVHIKKARPLVVEKLKSLDLITKIDSNYTHRLATNYRGGGIIEPQIKKQWMVAVNKKFKIKNSKIKGINSGSEVSLKDLMSYVVKNRLITITPLRFEKTYFHWIDNLRDWCISRQIWYGHRIPVWYKDDKIFVGASAPSREWEQDLDTLDTWFSSGLWTFSTLNWPEDYQNDKKKQRSDLSEFHPTSVLETGYDILFFWVARMILMSTYLLGEVPFEKVLLHGLVRDAEKQKMSKSKGNVIDPIDVSDKYGTDALRLSLIFSTASGSDIPMSEDRIRGMKHFANKIWNIARFIEMNRSYNKVPEKPEKLREKNLSELDKNFLNKTEDIIMNTTENIENFRLHDAAQNLYQFMWHDIADVYIEEVKKSTDENRTEVLEAIFYTCIKLLHPFMPFITEEINLKLWENKSIMVSSWPNAHVK